MTCSSAMYSDTATLTLKYHIWRITIRLDARGVRKNHSENDRKNSGGWISCYGIVGGARFEILAGNARGSEISISR